MRRRCGEGIAWHGTVPPQKWMTFSTEVLSRFAATPGLKLEVLFEVPPGEGRPRPSGRRPRVRCEIWGAGG